MKLVDTIESIDLCGPCFLRNDLIDSQLLIFCTLFNLKCGSSLRLARLADVK